MRLPAAGAGNARPPRPGALRISADDGHTIPSAAYRALIPVFAARSRESRSARTGRDGHATTETAPMRLPRRDGRTGADAIAPTRRPPPPRDGIGGRTAALGQRRSSSGFTSVANRVIDSSS